MRDGSRRAKASLLVICVSVLSSGCAGSGIDVGEPALDAYTVDATTTINDATEFGDQSLPRPFNLDCSATPTGVTYRMASGSQEPTPPCRDEKRAENTKPTATPLAGRSSFTNEQIKSYRNDLAYHLIYRSNAVCSSHRASIAAVSNGVNFGLGEIALAFNTIGALVSGEQAAKILSGAAGAVTATRSNFNETFYQNQLLSAILESIKNSREEKLTKIAANLDKPAEGYSAAQLVADIDQYHRLCSFVEGVTALAAAAKEIKTTNSEREGALVTLQYRMEQLKANLARVPKGKEFDPAREAIRKAIVGVSEQMAQQVREQSASPSSDK